MQRTAKRRVLSESGLDWTMTRLSITMGVAFVIGATLGRSIRFESPLFPRPSVLRPPGAGACTLAVPLVYGSNTRKARIAELEAQLPDALDFLARSMRAGHAFTISLEMVGEEIHDPLGQELRALSTSRTLGASLERSLASFAKRVPIPDVRFFSSAVLLQRQTGGNLGEMLNRLSHIIRERFRLKGQVKAVSAHGRLTATILTLLPDRHPGRADADFARLSRARCSPIRRGRRLVIAGVALPGYRKFRHPQDHQDQG